MTPLEAKQYTATVLLYNLATDLPEVLKRYARKVEKEISVTLVNMPMVNKPFIISLESRPNGIRVNVKNADALSVLHPDLHDEVWEIVIVDDVAETEEVMNTLHRCFDKLFEEQLTLDKLQSFRKHMVDNVSIRQHPIRATFFSKFLGNRIMGEYELTPLRKVSFVVRDGFFKRKPSAVFRFEDTDITGQTQITEMTRSEVYRYISKQDNE